MDVEYDLDSYAHASKLTSIPPWQELPQISKTTGAGIFLTGLLGFIISVVMSFLPEGA